MRFMIPLVFFAILLTDAAFAAPRTLSKYVRCNSDQTECSVETMRLTIGDRVGFFNSSNELSARGIVRSIKGNDRIVKILQSYGRIDREDRVESITKNGNYKTIQSEHKFRAGGSLGFANYNISGSLVAWEVGGFAAWSRPFDMDFPPGLSAVARGVFLMGSKDISRTIGVSTVNNTFEMMGFGVLVGGAYEGFRKSLVSARGELSIGGAYTSASLGSLNLDEDTKDAWDINVNDGFNVLLSARLELLYNGFDKWHPSFGASFTMHGSSSGPTILLGLVRDIE